MAGDPRVAFYIPSFERGGVERLIINISDQLIEQGALVDVLVYRHEPFIKQLPNRATVHHLRTSGMFDRVAKGILPVHVAAGVASLPKYVSYLSEVKPDLLISMQVSPFAMLGATLARTDATVVIRESNTPSVATASPDILIGKLAPHAKRLTYGRADQVVTVSEGAREDVIDWLNLDPKQVTAVYNPTNNDRIRELADEPLDHPWFETDEPVVVSVGRFYDQKDFETLIRAFSEVRSRMSARLVVVGDGPNRQRLESLAADLELKNVVDFVGYQENPYKYMAQADLFVLSSNYEGLPNVLIEALSVGTPVVATDCPSGPSEILLGGDGGWLVPVGATDEMAGAIIEGLEDRELAKQKLAVATNALDRFTPERAAESYLQLLSGEHRSLGQRTGE